LHLTESLDVAAKRFSAGFFTYNFMPRSSRPAAYMAENRDDSLFTEFAAVILCFQVHALKFKRRRVTDWSDKIFKRAKNDSLAIFLKLARRIHSSYL
jgi:hypothetical protein